MSDTPEYWPHIIALYSPRAGMGKSTLAAELAARVDSERVSFADPVREIEMLLIDMILPELGLGSMRRLSLAKARACIDEFFDGKNTPSQVLRGKTRRDLLIGIGEGLRDRFHPDIWTWIARARTADAAENEIPYVIIDDLRKPQELRWLQAYGDVHGRTTLVRLSGRVYAPAQNHIMEGELEVHLGAFDLELDNEVPPSTLADTVFNHIHAGAPT